MSDEEPIHLTQEQVNENLGRRLAEPPCPSCGGYTLYLEMRFKVTGWAILAGANPKASAQQVPAIVCRATGCGYVDYGEWKANP